MADDNKIGLEAIFTDENFQKGISNYNSSVKDASSNTDSAGNTMSMAWEGMAAVGEIAFTAVAAGLAALTAALGFAVSAAVDAQDEMARANFIISGTAERTGVTTKAVEDLAFQLTQVYPVDDEVMAQAIAMGLTFDGVTKDNIEPLIKAAADLASWTGRDLPSTMKALAMSVSDPEKAMRLLKEASITLTDEELKVFKGFKDTGDAAGATTFLLEQLKKKGIIGLGVAMGQTAKGKMTIMQTALGNMQEALGGGLLGSLSSVFDKITEFANDPKTVTFLTDLGNKIGELASTVISKLPDIMSTINGIATWLSNNKPLVIGILSAIGAAMLVFSATAIEAGVASAIAMWPVVVAMVAIGAAVALLYTAWTEDWGGIRESVAEAWVKVKPVFDKLQAWMKDNLPKAIKVLSDFWTKTLLPAMKTAFEWIADNVIPLLADLIVWLGDNVPVAIKATSDFFTKTLIPALKQVWDFINGTLIPIFKQVVDWLENNIVSAVKTVNSIFNVLMSVINALASVWTNVLIPAMSAVYGFISTYILPIIYAVANVIDAVFSVAVRVLAGLWSNVLYPAMVGVYNIIAGSIVPIFHTIASVISTVLSPVMSALTHLWQEFQYYVQAAWNVVSPFATFLSNTLRAAFQGVWDIVQKIITKINEWADAIRNLHLPAWLTPGSPTPFELGLRGINDEIDRLTSASLPVLRHQFEMLATVRDVPGSSGVSTSINNVNNSSRSNTYFYGANFNVSGPSGMLEALQGL